jgi:hypothetical protein
MRVTTQAEWEHQFELLRSGATVPTRYLRCGWWSQLARDPSSTWADLLTKDPDEHHYAALFQLTGPADTVPPQAVIAVPPGISSTPQGSEVLVLGWPEPGGACALKIGENLLIALGPATIPFRRPTLGVLMAAESPISRWQRLRRFK